MIARVVYHPFTMLSILARFVLFVNLVWTSTAYLARFKSPVKQHKWMTHNQPRVPMRIQACTVDIDSRTAQCLDFSALLDSVRENTYTAWGSSITLTQVCTTANEVRQQYEKVHQLRDHVDTIPLRRALNVELLFAVLENNTAIVTKDQLADFAEDITSILHLRDYILGNRDTLSAVQPIADELQVPQELATAFVDAFEADGALRDERYPDLRALRMKVAAAERQIVDHMAVLLQSPSLAEKLVDSNFVELDGRYCLAVLNTHKRGLGIAHGASNSGRTVYVEPFGVVEPTNELRCLRARLREEESRIFTALCRMALQHAQSVRRCVRAAAEVDVLAAKARLGIRLKGVIPEVGTEGIISCREAKHPLLLLRDRGEVVGNHLHLSSDQPALVISGPNAGGKTVILKMVGLFALMVHHGIPIPARAGARVDCFARVLADIGDMQSVAQDVSTFSGHLLACRAILEAVDQVPRGEDGGAAAEGGQALVLLDEVGTGTDPAQGAALAQALLERLLDTGARVVASTHFQRIKDMALTDPRCRIAAMEFLRGRPTYALQVGAMGESCALEVARGLELPAEMLARAEELVDDDSRRTAELQARLRESTEQAQHEKQEYKAKLRELDTREAHVEGLKQEAEALVQQLREGRAEEFLLDLKAKEREVDHMLQRAREVSEARQLTGSTSDFCPGVGGASGARANSLAYPNFFAADDHPELGTIHDAVKSLRVETERMVAAAAARSRLRATPLQPGQAVEAGTELMVLEPGSVLQGSCGVVTQRNRGRGRVALCIAGVELKMDRHLLGVPHPRPVRAGEGG